MKKPLVDHLEVAAKLARTEGMEFVAYLIEMAKSEASRADKAKAA